MAEKILWGMIGGTLAAGRRIYMGAQEHGSLKRAWETARKDVFVKTARDGAIGAGGGAVLGHMIRQGRKSTVEQFDRTWSDMFKGEALGKRGTFEPMPDRLMFTPAQNSGISHPNFNGQFSVTPVSTSANPSKRKYLLEFTRHKRPTLRQEYSGGEKAVHLGSVFKLPWNALPAELKYYLSDHYLEVKPRLTAAAQAQAAALQHQ